MSTAKRILICPLDWGLGHATRDIPIIRELLAQGAEPILASYGRPLALLAREFPDLQKIELPRYDVVYPTDNMMLNILYQVPRVVQTIQREHRFVRKLVRELRIDGIISDNRFGCYSPEVHSVFISHQLHVRVLWHSVENLARRLNLYFIRQFDECWIPDLPEAPGLSGELAHPSPLPNGKYIGFLSRFNFQPEHQEIYDILFLLSGPEPQRTRLQEMLLAQAQQLPGRMMFVLGKPEEKSSVSRTDRFELVSHLPANELEKVLTQSRLVVCRSGYSTLMDLARLNKRAILIPTPGQTEQEYLAEQLLESGRCYFQPQSSFDLLEALANERRFQGLGGMEKPGENRLQRVIARFLEQVASH